MTKPNDDGGYILPAEPDAPRLCVTVPVPDALEHKIAFLAQLDELGNYWNWQGPRSALRDSTALVWRGIAELVRAQLLALEEHCLMAIIDVRQNPVDACILEYTTDGVIWVEFADLKLCTPNLRINGATGRPELSTDGITWFEVADGPTDWPADQVPPSLRPAPLNPEPASPELACGIAIRLTNELERAWDQSYANEDDFLNTISGGGIGAFAGAALLFPGAQIPVAGAALLITAIRTILGLISASEVNSFDEDANERYRCYLLDVLNGGSAYDHTAQTTWANQIAADAENPQSGAIAQLLRSIPVETMQWLAYTATPVNNLDACPCDEPDFGVFLRQTACLEGSLLEHINGNRYRATSASCFGHHRVGITASNSDPNLCFRVISWERISGDTINAYRHSNCGTLSDSASGNAPTWNENMCIHAFGFEGTGNTQFVIEFEVAACL